MENKITTTIEKARKDWFQFVKTLPKYVSETPENVIADWWTSHLSTAIIEACLEMAKKEKATNMMNVSRHKWNDFASGYDQGLEDYISLLTEAKENINK